MESEAPPTPSLLLPVDAFEAEAKTNFDWEDIVDPSGATYTLQVAEDKNFNSMVLEKEGLTKSEYTITEQEKLSPTKKEAPYHWRVKAIDGASNGSEWSTPRSFYVGASFSMPSGVIYTLIVIGFLGLAFLAFWMGRRTAYSRRP